MANAEGKKKNLVQLVLLLFTLVSIVLILGDMTVNVINEISSGTDLVEVVITTPGGIIQPTPASGEVTPTPHLFFGW